MLLIILFGREGVDSTGLNIHRMLERKERNSSSFFVISQEDWKAFWSIVR